MKHTLQEMNISHVTTSYCHPQGNFRVEQFHQTSHDVMSKKVSDSLDTWDIYLNQVLAAIQFNIKISTKFSHFYLLYNCDPVLSNDIILKPRRMYSVEEPHKIALEQQYKSFGMVCQHLKKAKRRQARDADKDVSTQNFKEVTLPILNNSSTKEGNNVCGVPIIE